MLAVVLFLSARVQAAQYPLVWTQTNLGQGNLFACDHTPKGFVVLEGAGSPFQSDDGLSWKPMGEAVLTEVLAFTASPKGTLFVSIQKSHLFLDDGRIISSQFPEGFSADQVAWGNGLYVGLRGYTDAIYGNITNAQPVSLVSSNGVDWRGTVLPVSVFVSGSFPFADSVQEMRFGSGRFVAATHGSVVSSIDGIKWVRALSNQDLVIEGLCFGAGKFLIAARELGPLDPVGNPPTQWKRRWEYPVIFISGDGINWSKQRNEGEFKPGPLAYGNGVFLLVSPSGQVRWSVDGLNWRLNPVQVPSGIRKVCFGRDRFLCVGDNGLILSSLEIASLSIRHSEASKDVSISVDANLANEIQLQGSQDLETWSEITSPLWILESGRRNLTLPNNDPRRFFRVVMPSLARTQPR